MIQALENRSDVSGNTEEDMGESPEILYGDLNLDGLINADDITELRNAINNNVTEGYEQGNLNVDGKLNTKDIAPTSTRQMPKYGI